MEKTIQINYRSFDSWKNLSQEDQELIQEANDVLATAYAPYSKFKVGAAVLLDNGIIVKGSNQENIAYPSGLCAERVALFAVGSNYPKQKVKTICVVAKGNLVDVEKVLSPCGACRQVMVETQIRQKDEYRVVLLSQNGSGVIFNSASDLLPIAFGL